MSKGTAREMIVPPLLLLVLATLAIVVQSESGLFAASYANMLKSFRSAGPLFRVPVAEKFGKATGALGNRVAIEFCSEAFAGSRLR